MTAAPSTCPIFCVDAFTDQPFRGNPAAVCLLDAPLPDDQMVAIAAELNLSETAFVAEGDHLGLRWFTPTVEVQLCGHATLASVHALRETGAIATDEPVRFATRWKGILRGTPRAHGIELDFPAAPSRAVEAPAGLADALGAAPLAVGVNELHHVVELADASVVRTLAPDLAALAAIDEVEAVAVTAAGDEPGVDFVSRYFAPRHGIDEDPVTGSAHTSLGPWWSERLGARPLVGRQVSARDGTVTVTVGSPAEDRVLLRGDAVTVWSGTLRL